MIDLTNFPEYARTEYEKETVIQTLLSLWNLVPELRLGQLLSCTTAEEEVFVTFSDKGLLEKVHETIVKMRYPQSPANRYPDFIPRGRAFSPSMKRIALYVMLEPWQRTDMSLAQLIMAAWNMDTHGQDKVDSYYIEDIIFCWRVMAYVETKGAK